MNSARGASPDEPATKVRYRAYGLEWHVPSCVPMAWQASTFDPDAAAVSPRGVVDVSLDTCPAIPADAASVAATLTAHGRSRWWRIGNAGTFWTDGAQVIIDPAPDVDWALVGLVLAGQVAAEVLWHIGALPVRGSAAVTRHGAGVLLFGAPSSGTSTLARTLVLRGGSWLGDELSAVFPPGADSPRATIVGGSDQVFLAWDSSARMGIDRSLRKPVRDGTPLLASRVPRWEASLPRPLDWLVRMTISKDTEPSWTRKRGATATAAFLNAFATACVGSAARNATGAAEQQFQRVCSVANAVRRCQLARPDTPEVRLNDNARTLEAALR